MQRGFQAVFTLEKLLYSITVVLLLLQWQLPVAVLFMAMAMKSVVSSVVAGRCCQKW